MSEDILISYEDLLKFNKNDLEARYRKLKKGDLTKKELVEFDLMRKITIYLPSFLEKSKNAEIKSVVEKILALFYKIDSIKAVIHHGL